MYGFLHSAVGEESACNAGDLGSIPELGRSPEKVMAIHCSILAWKIPWTEQPGRLQSMGSQRVGHDGATFRSIRLQQYVNRELPDVQAGFRKGRRTGDQIAYISWIIEFQKKKKKHMLLLY